MAEPGNPSIDPVSFFKAVDYGVNLENKIHLPDRTSGTLMQWRNDVLVLCLGYIDIGHNIGTMGKSIDKLRTIPRALSITASSGT